MPEGETTPAYDGDNWTWTKAETVSGKAITPKCGETYYIKEVPATKFLQPYTHYTYYKSNNNITNLWMISDIDDTMYDETGFIITKNDEAKVCKSLTVKNQVGGASVKLTPKKVFGSKGATANDYLTYCEESGLITTTDGTPVAITMYWITPDKITVTGTTQRIISDGSNKDTISKTDEPISSTIN